MSSSASSGRISPYVSASRGGTGKAQCDTEAAAVDAVAHLDVRTVEAHDAMHQRQPDAAARRAIAGDAVEAVEDARALVPRDARPVVGYSQQRHAHFGAFAGRCAL